jgi:hypothetical protein
MQIRYSIVCSLALCLLLALGSCTKKLNTNQTDPNGVGINVLAGKDVFPQVLTSMVANKLGSNTATGSDNYDYASQYMGYFARSNSFSASGSQAEMETFSYLNSFSDGNWQSLYTTIYDMNFVMAHSSTNSILPGAARALRAMTFQDLVDQFGNIPYSQACQPQLYLEPKYDSAAAIYQDLAAQLDTAVTEIQASQSTADDASDVMFKGSKTLWTEFANTIKLRVLLRQVPNGNMSYVSAQLAKLQQQVGGFLGAGQDALVNPGYLNATQQQNPYWAQYGETPAGVAVQNSDAFCSGQLMIAFLDSINDPRIGYFFTETSAGTYFGNYFGETGNSSTPTSDFGPGVLQSPSMPALLFSAAQSFFMQAEAVQRGLMSGDAAALYKQGIEESFRYLTVPNATAAADAYIAGSTNGMVNFSLSTNQLQTILYQKWIAECELDGLEAYSDYRRTGYPFIAQVSRAAPGEPMPQRILYPETEYTQNPVNVNAQNQTAADLFTPIFWAQ